MAKPLSRNEINVLQENLDLFGEPQQEDGPAPKPGRPRKKNAKTATSAADKLRRKQPATQDMLEQIEPADAPVRSAASPTSSPDQADTPNPAQGSHTHQSHTNQSHTPQEPPTPPENPGPRPLYLAVRAKSATSAKDQLEAKGINVVNYAMEKRDPTLRNIHEALLDKGLEYRQGNSVIHWALVNHDQPTSQLLDVDIIEVAFETQWLETHKQAIRRLKGTDYLDACADIAAQLTIKAPALSSRDNASAP